EEGAHLWPEAVGKPELHHSDPLPILAGNRSGVAVDERHVHALAREKKGGGHSHGTGADDRCPHVSHLRREIHEIIRVTLKVFVTLEVTTNGRGAQAGLLERTAQGAVASDALAHRGGGFRPLRPPG